MSEVDLNAFFIAWKQVLGELVLTWGSIEQTVTLTIHAAHAFSVNKAKPPVGFKERLAAWRRAVEVLGSTAPHNLDRLHGRLTTLRETRECLVHGTFCGFQPGGKVRYAVSFPNKNQRRDEIGKMLRSIPRSDLKQFSVPRAIEFVEQAPSLIKEFDINDVQNMIRVDLAECHRQLSKVNYALNKHKVSELSAGLSRSG